MYRVETAAVIYTKLNRGAEFVAGLGED